MHIPLADAVPDTCGAKAAALGRLRRAGFRVPSGVVVPFGMFAEAVAHAGFTSDDVGRRPAVVAEALRRAPASADLVRELEGSPWGAGPVAVRSSAADEDVAGASAAGQYESFLGLDGARDIAQAVSRCWASACSARATAYRRAHSGCPQRAPQMAVIIQRHIDADASGVMFTQHVPGLTAGPAVIEASWGLGPSVVGGSVNPDIFHVDAERVTRRIASKHTRIDRIGNGLATRPVAAPDLLRPAIDDDVAYDLAALGHDVAALLGGPQDIEWAIAGGRIHLLQARPVTAGLDGARPATSAVASAGGGSSTVTPSSFHIDAAESGPARSGTAPQLSGTPGSAGVATGPARIVRGPGDFSRVRSGDVLACPFTDPAWTPLLGVAAGVVTETGGMLSHAAIVAREQGIPAVLGVAGVTTTLRDGETITVDGSAGLVTMEGPA